MQELLEQILSYLHGMWRYRWYSLALAGVVSMAGWAYVIKLPDQFEATARVYVDTQSVVRQLLAGLAANTSSASTQLGLMTRTLISRPNLEKVARMTDLDINAKSSEAMEELINDLRDKITVAGGGRDNLYSISVWDENPQLAKKIVQAVLTIFVENTLGETRQDSDTAQRFLDRQISEYEARLIAAENRVKEFKRQYMSQMPGEVGEYYRGLQASEEQLEQAKLQLRQVQNRRDALERQVQGEEPVFGLGPEAPSIVRSINLPVDARINTLEQQLDGLLLRYTEKHPDVIAARETLAVLKKQRDQEYAQYQAAMAQRSQQSGGAMLGADANPVYSSLRIALAQEEANLAAIETQVADYEQRVEELRKMVHTIPEVEVKYKNLNRDYAVTKQNYEALLSRRESARLSQDAGQTTDDIRFRIVEPPSVPSEPSGPNRVRLMSVVLVAAVAIGLGLSFVLSQLRPTFDSRRMLMEVTNVPVFGSVTAVLAPGSLRRQRIGMVVYLSLAACLLAIYAGLLVMQVTGIRIL